MVSFYNHFVLILLNNAAWVVLFPEKTTPNWNVDSFNEIKIGFFDKRQNDKIKTIGLTQRYGKYVTYLPFRMDSRFTGVSWQFRALGWCALHFNMFWQKKCTHCPWLSFRKGNWITQTRKNRQLQFRPQVQCAKLKVFSANYTEVTKQVQLGISDISPKTILMVTGLKYLSVINGIIACMHCVSGRFILWSNLLTPFGLTRTNWEAYLTNYRHIKRCFHIWLIPWSDRKGWRVKDFNWYISQISDHINLFHMCDVQLRSVKQTSSQHIRRKLPSFDYRQILRFSWQR